MPVGTARAVVLADTRATPSLSARMERNAIRATARVWELVRANHGHRRHRPKSARFRDGQSRKTTATVRICSVSVQALTRRRRENEFRKVAVGLELGGVAVDRVGFRSVEVHELAHDVQNCYYISRP